MSELEAIYTSWRLKTNSLERKLQNCSKSLELCSKELAEKNSKISELVRENMRLKLGSELDRKRIVELEQSEKKSQELVRNLDHLSQVLNERNLTHQNEVLKLKHDLKLQEQFSFELSKRLTDKNSKVIEEFEIANESLFSELWRAIRDRDLMIHKLFNEIDKLKVNQERKTSNLCKEPMVFESELDFSAICDDKDIFKSPSKSKSSFSCKYQNCPRVFERQKDLLEHYAQVQSYVHEHYADNTVARH